MPRDEKRKLERFDLKVPAKIAGETEGEYLDLVTNNICAGGAFFHTDQSLPEGTKVRVDLLLPLEKLKGLIEEYDQAHVQLTGRVVRIEPRGMAVCFNNDYSIRPRRGKGKVWH